MRSRTSPTTVAIAALVALAAGAFSSSEALAASGAAKAKPRVGVVAKPAVLRAGGQANVTVKATGARGRLLKLVLQQRVGKAWVAKGTRSIKGSGRFALVYRAPSRPSTATLRVSLRRASRSLAKTRTFRVLITKRPGGGPTVPPGGAVTPPPGGGITPPPGGGPATPPPPPPPATILITPSSVVSVPEPGAPGTVTIAGRVDLKAGDIIASDSGPDVPYGFLRKVVSSTFDGTNTLVETTQATLPEAVPEGSFDVTADLGEQEAGKAKRAGTPSSSSSAHSNAIHRKVRTVLECESEAKVVVEGDISLKAEVKFSGGWSFVHGPHARVVGSAQASSQLKASAAAAASCAIAPRKLFERELPSIRFFAGPVPVLIFPKLSVFLSADGEVEAHVETEVHGSLTAEAGLEYEDGSIDPISNFDKNFGYTPPAPSGSATLGAKLSPTIEMLLYGVAGPEVAFNAGLRLDAATDTDPAWTLKAPVSLTAKLDVPVLDISTGTLTVFEHSFLLAQAGGTETQGFIRFDEFPLGTVISNQYADKGVVFDESPFLTGDGANPTSPVLSGAVLYTSPIRAHFVEPGTDTPTTMNTLQLDTGYIDNPGSVEIVAQLANGTTRTAIADHLGIDQISIAARNITGFSVQAVRQEDAGFAIDNLGFSK